jgi:hypothetical protein
MSKPDLASAGNGIVVGTLRANRMLRHDRALGKVEADLGRDTFNLEAQRDRLVSDREDTATMSEERLRALEAKVERKNWLRDVREDLTGQKNRMKKSPPPSPYRVFDHIWKTWVRKHEPDDGVEISLAKIAKGAKVSEDFAREIIREKLGPYLHIENGGQRPNRYRPKYL